MKVVEEAIFQNVTIPFLVVVRKGVSIRVLDPSYAAYSGVPNRRTGLNKRTGWKYIKKLINAQGLIIIIL